MGATFNRLKTWIGETLTPADINAEFNNILNNLTPGGVDDYSANTTEMRTQTDPGEVGSESLAQSAAQELARLRYAIAEMKGTTYWYQTATTSLNNLNDLVGQSGIQNTRVVSGKTTGTSQQSILLTPEGSGNNLTINATATDLVVVIDGTQYTFTTDIVITSTTTPPTTNNTAAVINAQTKYAGIGVNGIMAEAVGSEIQSRTGRVIALRRGSGGSSEYILCRTRYSGSLLYLHEVKRGWFFDSTNTPVPALAWSAADTLTLMNIVYVFVNTAGVAITTYSEPVYSATQPSAPASGDMWYDTDNQTWKLYNGSSYVSADAVYIGMGIIDENGNCVAARSTDFAHAYTDTNNIRPRDNNSGNGIVSAGGSIGVFGKSFNYYTNQINWSLLTHLDTGVTETASTLYFFYIKETGEQVISDVAPQFFANRGGWYHSYQTWRCVAQGYNDNSSLLESICSYHPADPGHAMRRISATGALTINYFAAPTKQYSFVTTTVDNGSTDYMFEPGATTVPFMLSITIPSTATLDHSNSIMDNVVVHLAHGNQFNSADLCLAVSSHQWGQSGPLDTTTQIAVIGAGSDSTLLYTTNDLSDFSLAYAKAVGFIRCSNATAGTWTPASDWYMSIGNDINVCRRKFSAATTNFSNATGNKTDVLNVAGFAKTGRAVRIYLQADANNGANPSYIALAKSAVTTASCSFILQDTAAAGTPTVVHRHSVAGSGASGTIGVYVPASSLSFMQGANDTAALPLYFCIQTADSSTTGYVLYSRLVAEELPHGVSG